MSKKKITILSILGVIALILIIMVVKGISVRNDMVSREQQVNKSWSNVESAYQRRLDLIPNLVSTVKGYAAHEKSTLTDVTAMRTGVAKAAEDLEAAAKAAKTQNGPDAEAVSPQRYNNLDRALGIYVNAVHEAYPQLMANENFLDLQAQLEGTENRINTERNRYNEQVADYNTYIRKFPANIIAGLCGFGTKQFFKADEAASSAPVVSFD